MAFGDAAWDGTCSFPFFVVILWTWTCSGRSENKAQWSSLDSQLGSDTAVLGGLQQCLSMFHKAGKTCDHQHNDFWLKHLKVVLCHEKVGHATKEWHAPSVLVGDE